MNSFGL